VEEELHDWVEQPLLPRPTEAAPPGPLPGAIDKDQEEDLVYDEDDDEANNDESAPKSDNAPKGKRGQNLLWRLHEKFETKEEFDASEVKTEIETKYKQRKVRSTTFAEKVLFECHFERKRHYKKCPFKYQVNYSNSSDNVLVETVGEHEHEALADENVEQNRKYLKWTDEQTKVVLEGVKHNLDPTNIRRALKDSNLFLGIFPTLQQINNKIALVRKSLVNTKITMTADLRKVIETILEEPEDENEAFIVDYEIKDDEGEKNVRFHCTWTTKKMRRRINPVLAQGDATYRLNWMGFPVLVSGTSTTTGKFFPWAITLTTNENSNVWSSVELGLRLVEIRAWGGVAQDDAGRWR